ncbi:MAG: multicopper oxidase family protein [Acidobacteriales bacterium]|nr:multicopper oxidase family protein [Terriglobales bacterium]
MTLRSYTLRVVTGALALLVNAFGAAPGIQGPAFQLTASPAYLTQPDGQAVYSWGYGCTPTPGSSPKFLPSTLTTTGFCSTMQVPGPTLIVTEGDSVTVTLTNKLPSAAGNTSILFPGFAVTTSGGVGGVLTQEAAQNTPVTYSFTASTPGTHAYYSGTQGDLQIEMGLYGALIVLPKSPVQGTACIGDLQASNDAARTYHNEQNFRLVSSAYDDPHTCYDREYLFQFSEMDPAIHSAALAQVTATGNCTAGAPGCSLNVPTEPYHPTYFLINGRSMPDDMDPNYSPQYPHQPYNGNPHLHPGEQVLLRIIGQGRWQHPFHEHANHVRVLARDGNLLLTPDGAALAGPALFTTTTTPGMAMDGIFYYTGRGLNWDMYGHNPKSTGPPVAQPPLTCNPDANGYNTGDPKAINYYEWCADHNKPLEQTPFGDVGANGPITLPNPNILTNGNWYGGSPYLGPDATLRATGCMAPDAANTNAPNCATTGVTPPSGTIANSPANEAAFAFMWHSHNEREITTNNMFPGGMMMMMLVDSREFPIDESN